MIYQYSSSQFQQQTPSGRISQSHQKPPCVVAPSSYLPPPVNTASSVPAEKHAAGKTSGMAASGSQACVAGSVMNSPSVQIRASRAQPMTGAVLRAVPTPARAGAATSRGEERPPWGADCVAWLAAEGDEGRFLGRARFLDKYSVTSVQDAIDGLNSRIFYCPEDVCVVRAAAEKAFYMVYRRGRLDGALGALGLTREELARISAAGNAGTMVPSSTASEGRHSLCEMSEQLSIAGRPSISEAHSKVVRQASMPSRPTARERMHSVHRAAVEKGPVAAEAVVCHGAAVIEEHPVDVPVAAWMSVHSTTAPAAVQSATPASTPGAPPPVGITAAMQPATAIAVAPMPGASAPKQSGYQRFPAPGPTRGNGTAAFQSYQPVASASPTPASALPQALVTARPPARNPAVGGAPRTVGKEARHSVPPTQALPAAPCRRVHSTGAAPTGSAVEDDCVAAVSQHEALERDLSEVEKVNYCDLNFVENLGSGEFGQVFRGFYRGEEVAIKKLYWDDTFTDGVLQDLAKEIESFRHLRHKRLVRFIGACFENSTPCLVTQYMPGGSLHHLLHTRKLQLPTLHATNMCLQLTDGVMYLHSRVPTIVHRDLKSLNVVLDLNLNVKICDFGLTESMERTHITKQNNGGSPRYMAPELFDCKTKITEKIDVWALGCIFVEIFGGPLPYESINTLADLTREMLVNRRSPDVPEFIMPEIRAVISRCLDFDHRLRLTSKQVFEQLKAAKKELRQTGRLEGPQDS